MLRKVVLFFDQSTQGAKFKSNPRQDADAVRKSASNGLVWRVPYLPRSPYDSDIPESASIMFIVLTPFARARLFPKDRRLNAIQDVTPDEFERYLNEHEPMKVLDGYAPFCKLHVHRNWTSTRCYTMPITDDNRHLLRSGYEARTKAELPVLVRWFEGVEPPVANYLVVILYSREQMEMEGDMIDGDWGIVGCMYTEAPEEIPMAPITMMRNALGVEEGGSGVAMDREAYRRSAE